ncbi:Hypothetical Protein FCC1311_073172 [Hondaea fermentalgiana]|uniref:Uncharacterized protein n=1 Tax=Hondaea fermentalgiana TaxID=2315210 RepID=A0A2R5GJM7_9STRA|nr:Hypothetical Protein FCC1311_073172 [Hondaea fermentalgiana]|eukprot:GBG31096.1 Hypothetical Protein FCC1311_073172 [Hondaea fermentalgiana]
MEKLSNTSQSTDDESPENNKPAEKHDAKAESEEPVKSVHGDADDSKVVAADSQHVLESADEEDTEVDSDDSGDNAGFPVAKTQRRKRIGCLEVGVLDSKQIAKDGSRHFVDGELSRALGYSLALGATSYRSPRLDAIVRERAALRKEDNLKRLTSFPAAQQRISETPVWAPGEKYVFDVLDLAGDLEMVLYKTSGSMSLMNRRVLGQINIPVIDLLEGCEGWFEIFPRSKRFKKRRVRPAVPVIDKSGLDFPRMSLGYVKIRVRTQLCIKESSLWKLYIAQLHPLELKDSFRATYRSVKIKDSLESFTEIRRNAIRINIVRAYLYTHLVHGPCTLLDLVCSWDSPLLTLSSWLFAFLLIFVIPIWMYPLAMAISLILASRAYLEGQHLTMNWATVPRPAKKDLLQEEEEVDNEEIVTEFAGDNLKDAVHNNAAGDPAESDIAPDDIPNGSTSGSSHAAAVPHVSTTDDALPHANETGNSLEVDEETDVEDDDFAVQGESAAQPSSSVRELPSGHRFDRPEDGVFVRDDFAEDFFVWNHQISDPKRGLNLIERSTLAWRELRWVQELTCDIAEAGEKLSLTLSRANPYASTAVDILVICAGAIFSLVFYLRSYFPVIAQSALFGAYVLATSPPAIRSTIMMVKVFGVVLAVLVLSTNASDNVTIGDNSTEIALPTEVRPGVFSYFPEDVEEVDPDADRRLWAIDSVDDGRGLLNNINSVKAKIEDKCDLVLWGKHLNHAQYIIAATMFVFGPAGPFIYLGKTIGKDLSKLGAKALKELILRGKKYSYDVGDLTGGIAVYEHWSYTCKFCWSGGWNCDKCGTKKWTGLDTYQPYLCFNYK